MEVIKYDMINSIGMELFRKNNSTFLKDPLSPIMGRIFKAANSPYVENIDTDFYMKSGILHNRVFYIYSNELTEKYPHKTYDIVYFNNEICVWIYSKNAINMIDKNPINTIYNMYRALISTFMPAFASLTHGSFISTEYNIAALAMTINLIIFLNETYGALDIDECKAKLIKKVSGEKDENEIFGFYADNLQPRYEIDSTKNFIEDIFEKCTDKNYFNNREFLDSYLLLKRTTPNIAV